MKSKILFFITITALCCTETITSIITQHEKRDWTILIYMAADNDLFIFSKRNLQQLLASSYYNTIHIAVCYFHKNSAQNKKVVHYYHIINGTYVLIKEDIDHKATNSGDEQNVIDFCSTVFTQLPADNYALFFWDHGTGPINPIEKRNQLIDNKLTHFNSTIMLHAKNNKKPSHHKSICFDDTHNSCLTEQKLKYALSILCPLLPKKKFDLVGFDTCLMATIEIASLIAPFASYMVASQDLEPGTGWNYAKVLSIFTEEQKISPFHFSCHIVEKFKETYHKKGDYTLSAFDLSHTQTIEYLSKMITKSLIVFLQNDSIFTIQDSRDPDECPHFFGTDYVDLIQFYKNLLKKIRNISKLPLTEEKQRLKYLLQQCIATASDWIIYNKTSNSHEPAHGVSIYFPMQYIHHSYKSNLFANNNAWLTFLYHYKEIFYE